MLECRPLLLCLNANPLLFYPADLSRARSQSPCACLHCSCSALCLINAFECKAYASGWERRSLYVRVGSAYTSPQEADQQIRIPLEEQFSTVKNLDHIRTWSSSSGVRARLYFNQDVNMRSGLQSGFRSCRTSQTHPARRRR